MMCMLERRMVGASVPHTVWPALARVAAAWLLGFAYPFWADAIVAEVYTLDAALVAAMILCLVHWRIHRSAPLLALAFLFLGLSLANRTTNALNIPVVMLFLLP